MAISIVASMDISNHVYMCMNIGRQSMKIVKRDVFTVKKERGHAIPAHLLFFFI